jgi:hypothetical protein
MKIPKINPQRRQFLKSLGIGAGLAALPVFSRAEDPQPSRPAKAKYMGGFAAPKLETVRVACIGVCARGAGHAAQLAEIEGAKRKRAVVRDHNRGIIFRKWVVETFPPHALLPRSCSASKATNDSKDHMLPSVPCH